MFDRQGEITPPCGEPSVAWRRSPSSSTPAFSHLRRGSGAVSAPVLVLRPSRGLHHGVTGLRKHQPCCLHFQSQADLRLPRNGLSNGRNWIYRLRGLGPSHVHRRYVEQRPGLLCYRQMVIAVPNVRGSPPCGTARYNSKRRFVDDWFCFLVHDRGRQPCSARQSGGRPGTTGYLLCS